MGARPQGRSAVHPSAPKLRPQHRKSHLKASLGGSYGGAGGVLGHPFNCLSTGTPASCASPASGHRHSGCLGSGRSEFTPYLCCFSARCSGQVLEPASAKEWCLLAPGVGVGWLRGLLGTGGGPGEMVLLVLHPVLLAPSRNWVLRALEFCLCCGRGVWSLRTGRIS